MAPACKRSRRSGCAPLDQVQCEDSDSNVDWQPYLQAQLEEHLRNATKLEVQLSTKVEALKTREALCDEHLLDLRANLSRVRSFEMALFDRERLLALREKQLELKNKEVAVQTDHQSIEIECTYLFSDLVADGAPIFQWPHLLIMFLYKRSALMQWLHTPLN